MAGSTMDAFGGTAAEAATAAGAAAAAHGESALEVGVAAYRAFVVAGGRAAGAAAASKAAVSAVGGAARLGEWAATICQGTPMEVTSHITHLA